METTTITSTAIWYHISSSMGDSSSRWTKGAARKGVYNGKSGLSMILFDAGEIREAIGESFLQEAELVISRDAAYGTDSVTVCVAPAYISSMSESYMSRSECIRMAKRNLHKCYVIEGETATFDIPGAMLREMYHGEVNAFFLYQEADGTDSYCRFGDSAELKLYTGSDLTTPVWTRTISAGDTICNEIHSHYADLREIEYYINLRNQYYSQASAITEMTILQLYGEWTSYIQGLRDKAETFLQQESRTYDWTPLPTGKSAWDNPQADVINNLRGIFRAPQGDRYESDGFMAAQSSTVPNGEYRTTESMAWSQPSTLITGTVKQSEKTGRQPAIYQNYACGWIFSWNSGEIEKAEVELTIRLSSNVARPHIQLLAITAGTVPTNATYNGVFGSTIMGEGDCKRGTTNTIEINSAGLELMRNGAVHGIGIRYEGEKIELSKTATLVINDVSNP